MFKLPKMSSKRPTSYHSINKIKQLSEAIKWENDCIKEFNNLYTTLFDPMLDLIKINDNNDKLNQLLKQLKMWKWHINNKLNGKSALMDKSSTINKLIKNGKLILGKLYFGRSIELPEIRSQLEKSNAKNVIDLNKLAKLNKNHSFYKPIQPQTTIAINKEQPNTSNEINKNNINQVNNNLLEFEKFYTNILQDLQRKRKPWRPQNKIGKIPTLKDMELEIVKRRKAKLLKELDL